VDDTNGHQGEIFLVRPKYAARQMSAVRHDGCDCGARNLKILEENANRSIHNVKKMPQLKTVILKH
jgi:hypothetical protein